MKIDINVLKKNSEAKQIKTDSIWWSPKMGENKIRILEAPDGVAYSSNPVYYKHFSVGPNSYKLWCPKSNGTDKRDWNNPCPVCDAVSLLYKTGAEEDKKFAGSISAKPRVILNIVDLNDTDKGVKFFECPSALWKEILKWWEERGNLADKDKGYNFLVVKEGTQDRPDYSKSKAEKTPSAIQNLEWLKQFRNPEDFIKPYIKSAEDIKSIMETGVFPQKNKIEVDAFSAPTVTNESDDNISKDVIHTTTTTKTSKKKPPCYSEHEDGNSDCEECSWEELCIEESDTDNMDKLEKDIMASMKKK